MRCFCFFSLLAVVVLLPDTQAAPAPKSRFAKPAIIDTGTEKNIAGVLENIVWGARIGVREDKKVANLPIVRRQKDWEAWLKKNLRVERIPDKNLGRVSFRDGTPQEQAAIINIVVDHYLKEDIGKTRGSLTANLKIDQARWADPRLRRKLKVTPADVAKWEKELKEREESIRNLPALVEHAKAR